MSAETTEEVTEPTKPLFVDRRALLKALDEFHAAVGFVPDNTGTVQEIRQRMIDGGVRPEAREFSRAIIAARYPDEDE